jgi:hypothetical protein
VQIVASIAAHPAGKLTQVFSRSDQLLGAFRFIESEHISPQALAASAHLAAARRSRCLDCVLVAVDQTDLRLIDPRRTKGLGQVGSTCAHARGLQVLNALCLRPDGVPLGLVGQQYWSRHPQPRLSSQRRRRIPVEHKETQLWLQSVQDADQLLAQYAPCTRPWYQLDRGADAWPMLLLAQQLRGWITVRAAWDRRLWRQSAGEQSYLWETLGAQEPHGSYLLQVPAGYKRPERTAVMQVRVAQVDLDLKSHAPKKHYRTPMTAVLVREEAPPPGAEPIQWMLLSTYPVLTLQDAYQVVFAYSQRWKIEEFHRLWKSGACDVEATQLSTGTRIQKWAVLLSSVAVRIQRLTMLARQQPELPATAELEQGLIDAAIVATEQTKWKVGQGPPLGQVVLWIAQIGGYTGKSSGGPPGALVLSRGLKRLELLARYGAQLHRRYQDERPKGDKW